MALLAAIARFPVPAVTHIHNMLAFSRCEMIWKAGLLARPPVASACTWCKQRIRRDLSRAQQIERCLPRGSVTISQSELSVWPCLALVIAYSDRLR